MAYRPEFLKGLSLLVEAMEEMAIRGLPRPVLVGGAAVELWTGSSVTSGDFDLVSQHQKTLEEILLAKGFVRPKGPGALLRGLHHPELGLGIEVVSGSVLDGAVPPDRLVTVELETGGKLVVISVEDIIADRLGQYAAHEASHREMLEQAIQLHRLAEDLDVSYLDRRIREETAGTYDLAFLRKMVAEYEDRSSPGPREAT